MRVEIFRFRKWGLFGVAICLSVAWLCGMTGCRMSGQAGEIDKMRPESVGLSRTAGLPLEMLRKAGLDMIWQVHLPMEAGRSVKKVFYHHGHLYVINSRNTLLALDGEKGIIQWTQSLGDSRPECMGPEYYQDRLLFALGNRVVEVRESNGTITYEKELKIIPTTTVGRTEDRLLLGSFSQFYSLRREDTVPLWHSAQPADSVGRVVVRDKKVYFVDVDGTAFAALTDQRELLWKATTSGQLVGVVLDEDECYLPSTDTVLYCFDAETGEVNWKYLSGGMLGRLPTVTGQWVYQPVAHSSLVCLKRRPESGNPVLQWELKNGCQFLAEHETKSYVMTHDQELTLMDNLQGKRVLSFYMPGLDLWVGNPEDNKIFLANQEGLVVALKPLPEEEF